MKIAPLEERIYRHRCVERWSIVVPWIGFSLERSAQAGGAHVESQIRRVPELLRSRSRCPKARTPASSCRTSKACASMKPCIRWRCCASGMYGEVLPNQNGAPLRLAVPWKYGFKSIKSIVKIKLVEKAASHHVEPVQRSRVRLLFQRESRSGPSALEPGQGAQAAAMAYAPDAEIQRIRRPGREPLRGHGSQEVLLAPAHA